MKPEPLDTMFEKEAIDPVTASAALGGLGYANVAAAEPKTDPETGKQHLGFWGKIQAPVSIATGKAIKPVQEGIKSIVRRREQQEDVRVQEEALDEMFDPAHEAELQKIKIQAMLSEFMSTDPVISTYDQDDVLTAYNQIVQIAPRTARQPAVMRGLLRKMLQQQDALEPFEAKELVEIEKGIRDVQQGEPPAIAAMRSAGEAAGVLPTGGGTVRHTAP